MHRALASPVRRRMLAFLRAEPGEVPHLADRFGLHPNTVRAHLAVLEDAGLVVSESARRDGPGRPRLRYRATLQGAEVTTDDRGYRFLATMLASHLSAGADPAGEAQRIGATWGHHLVDRPAPFAALDAGTGVARLVEMLDELGFDPELDATEPSRPTIALRRCPFLDVARDHQEVVCAVHLGLMRGALDELDVTVRAQALHPFVAPDRCVTELEVPA